MEMVNHQNTAKGGLNLPRLLDNQITSTITIGKINRTDQYPKGVMP